MSIQKTINLSELSDPNIITVPSFDEIYKEMLEELKKRMPEFSANVESEPALKILQAVSFCAHRLLHDINQAGQQTMLAFARGTNLDNLGALLNVKRHLIQKGNEDAMPQVDSIYESDKNFRDRIQTAPNKFSCAGSTNSYEAHAKDAHSDVLDVSVTSKSPGVVNINILSLSNNGEPSNEVLEAVKKKLNHDDVRPLTDCVLVEGATIIDFNLHLKATVKSGPDGRAVINEATQKLKNYLNSHFKLGGSIAMSRLYGAFANDNIERVELISPAKDLILEAHQAPRCIDIDIEWEEEV